jgi:hypothetical protein
MVTILLSKTVFDLLLFKKKRDSLQFFYLFINILSLLFRC